MRVLLLTLTAALLLPATAGAQTNQTSRTIVDRFGDRVTCTVGQIGTRSTRGVAIISTYSSRIDADPSDELWRTSGCHAEMSMTPQQRYDRTMAMIAAGPNPGQPRPGEPDTRFEDLMAQMFPDRARGGDRPSLGGATYVTRVGDTLTGISRRFEVPLAEIERANQRSFRGSIGAGERITLPQNAVDGGADPYAMGSIVSAR